MPPRAIRQTQVLIGNFEVATGEVIAPTVQQTRVEADFANLRGRQPDHAFNLPRLFERYECTIAEWLNRSSTASSERIS